MYNMSKIPIRWAYVLIKQLIVGALSNVKTLAVGHRGVPSKAVQWRGLMQRLWCNYISCQTVIFVTFTHMQHV